MKSLSTTDMTMIVIIIWFIINSSNILKSTGLGYENESVSAPSAPITTSITPSESTIPPITVTAYMFNKTIDRKAELNEAIKLSYRRSP